MTKPAQRSRLTLLALGYAPHPQMHRKEVDTRNWLGSGFA